MHKVFKILLVLLALWLTSSAIAMFFFADGTVIGEQIAVIPITGVLTLDGGSMFFQQTLSAEEIVFQIQDAQQNSAVKGIVLEINSPGGTVLGSKKIADAVDEVTEKPVVAIITEQGTSGAYWVASQADVVVADPLSLVGSIGVIGSYLEFGGLLSDYNVSYQRLVIGEYKDITSPYREMTDAEEALLLERLQGVHEYMVKDIAEGRGLTIAETSEIANGLFYLGQDALELGLVDELGDTDDAIAIVRALAGISGGQVTEYEKEETIFDVLKQYLAYSSFYMGQGIGTAILSVEQDAWDIRV